MVLYYFPGSLPVPEKLNFFFEKKKEGIRSPENHTPIIYQMSFNSQELN